MFIAKPLVQVLDWLVVERNNAASDYPSDFDVVILNETSISDGLKALTKHPSVKHVTSQRMVRRTLKLVTQKENGKRTKIDIDELNTNDVFNNTKASNFSSENETQEQMPEYNDLSDDDCSGDNCHYNIWRRGRSSLAYNNLINNQVSYLLYFKLCKIFLILCIFNFLG